MALAQSSQGTNKRGSSLDLEFSIEGGFYDEELLLELYSIPGARIYYTLDGSLPRRSSRVYKRPIKIKSNTVVRAIARRGRKKSKHYAHTYFIDEERSSFPVISLAVPPHVLFDPETGLFMKGSNAIDSLWTLPGANFWTRSETVINAEIFETDGNCEYNSLSGLRLFGGMSRLFPQKSMTIVARKRYGEKKIKHRIFGKEGLRNFKFLVLRNSGSDWGKSHFRDGVMTSLLDGWDMEKQDYRPSQVYINGKYWGIYNIREKVNRYFLEDHLDIDKDSLELMEHRFTRKRGSRRHYRKMLQFLEENDLSDPASYAYLNALMDVRNFMEYQIAQIYFDNRDAGGNIKYWRPGTEGGKWRWILYDTDWGFGLHSEHAYKNNSIKFHTQANGPTWPNPPWSTFILRKLLENDTFRDEFVNSFADHLNTSFESRKVVNTINQFYKKLQPEMKRHLKRWRLSERVWQDHVRIMKIFAVERPAYMRKYLQEYFDVGEQVGVDIEVSGGGKVVINENIPVFGDFSGKYFRKLPVRFKAVPNFGFRFSHWEGVKIEPGIRGFILRLKKSHYKLKAVFVKSVHPLAGKILINEVSPNNKQSGDWIELYNNTEETVNLQDWVLADLKNEFNIPNAVIRPKSYLILCENMKRFQKTFPDRTDIVGSFKFGLNKHKEVLNLYSSEGAAVDSMSYYLEPTDSIFTVGLLLPFLDNSNSENWEQNFGSGSPSRANPYYLESRIKAKQERAMMLGGVAGIFLVFIFLLMVKRAPDKP